MLIPSKVNRFTALVFGLGTIFVIGGADASGKSGGTKDSSPQQLVQHLKANGIRFYGSWTCPACHRQLKLFSPERRNTIPYVECNKPEQFPDQAKLCREADLRVYPTWERSDGSRLEGVQSLETLGRWSGLK